MKEADIAAVRAELEEFVGDVFASLPRADQRAKGSLYLRGLMLDGKRKSMQPMAERLGVDFQQLQQFVSSSQWRIEPVRRVIATRATETITPEAWVIDDTGFKKDGASSPGVARQYSGTLGKIGNCQIGVSIHLATDTASCPVNWRLFIPESWDDTCAETNEDAERIHARRDRSRLPDTARNQTKWSMGLEMIDQLISWHLTPPTLVGDAGYGNATGFRLGLTKRHISYVLAVTFSTTAYPDSTRPETTSTRPRLARYRTPALSLKELALAAGRAQAQHVRWRKGTQTSPDNPAANMESDFLTLRIRAANRDIPLNNDGSLPAEWLLVEWPKDQTEPTDYWLSTLPETTPIAELVRLAKMRWRIEHDYRELKTGLGLAHFEGRTWLGWNHHATLVSAAHLFLTTLRLTHPKASGAA